MQRRPRPKLRNGKIDWQKQLRFDMEFAKQMLRECGTFQMLTIIYPQDGSPIVLRPGNAVSKASYFRMAQLLAISCDAKAFSMMTEAWMAPADTTVAPSQSERRQEVILVVICYRDESSEKQWLGDTAIIERDASGKISGFTDFDSDSIAPEHWRTRDLLPNERPTPAVIAEAQQLLDEMLRAGAVSKTEHDIHGHA